MREKIIRFLAILYIFSLKRRARHKANFKKRKAAFVSWYSDNIGDRGPAFERNIIIVGLIIICILIGVIVASVKSINEKKHELEKYVQEASTEVIDIPAQSDYADNSDWVDAVNKLEKDADEGFWYGKLYVDMISLKEINEDIVGWIYFEAEDISYPILYSGENETYSRNNYRMESDAKGSIFLDGANNTNFEDHHSLIYGHNVEDLSMFGQLKYYKEKNKYYDNHQYFQIILLDPKTLDLVKYRYHIFACRDASEGDGAYNVWGPDDEGIDAFAKKNLTVNSYISDRANVEIKKDDYVVTLSASSENGERLLLSAVRESTCRITYRK